MVATVHGKAGAAYGAVAETTTLEIHDRPGSSNGRDSPPGGITGIRPASPGG